jgi:hypothetical protein
MVAYSTTQQLIIKEYIQSSESPELSEEHSKLSLALKFDHRGT